MGSALVCTPCIVISPCCSTLHSIIAFFDALFREKSAKNNMKNTNILTTQIEQIFDVLILTLLFQRN